MRILAIGAHIGDPELMTGPYLCQKLLEGNTCQIVALTAGERGNPNLPPATYRRQKLKEAHEFAEKLGIQYEVFVENSDAYLNMTEELVQSVESLIINNEVDEVITHWRGSFHPDHRATHEVVSKAVLRINVNRYGFADVKLRYAENWEDMESFNKDELVEISDEAFSLWADSIKHEEFVYGGFSKFRHLEYYSALMTLRGCLNGTNRAVALMEEKLI